VVGNFVRFTFALAFVGCNGADNAGAGDLSTVQDFAVPARDSAVPVIDASAAVDQAIAFSDLAIGDQSDPCGADLQNDPANCGACGHACAVAHGTPGCTLGQCVIAKCDPGFADCDGDIANGCELNITMDVDNCGACGKKCSAAPPGMANCMAGACAFTCAGPPASLGHCCCPEANPGFCDCDGKPMNGCEINARIDVNNCGACGVTCGQNQHCVNGACL
jgi:hypothetical protein